MGHIERKLKEKEIKRKDIIDAAERVFFTKGYDNSSMDEVAKEAEYSKRTIYVYFSSKEQIYFEIMIRGYQILIGMIQDSFKENSPGDAVEELRCIFMAFFDFSRNYSNYFKAIMEYETKASDNQPEVEDESKKECYRMGEQLFGYLFRALQKGVEEGSLKSEVSSETTALILWSCTIGIYNTVNIKGEYLKNYHNTDPNEFITESFKLFMQLISR